MAIRIIEEKPDPSVVKTVICRKCGVKLEYVPIDIKSYTSRNYGGGSDTYYYIPCLKCNNQVPVRGY